MSRFQIKPGLPFYLLGLAGKGDMFSCGYLCNLHTFGLNLRTSVAIFASLSQFTHFCRGARYSAIYAFWEPKKNVNLGFRAKKTEFPAMHEMLPGCKPDYNASNFAVNARFFELDERIALCIFSTENALQKTTLLLLLSQGYWVLRHLHGLLIPGVHWPKLL